MGPYDVGQAVVVSDGRLEAVEGVEGTDGMLARVAAQRARGNGQAARRGILVKRQKPGQEVRIDLPAIGPGTVETAIKAGLAGIAVQARGGLAADRAELVRRADAGGIFVQGWKIEAHRPAARAADLEAWRSTAMGARTLEARHDADAAKGAGLLMALAPFGGVRCTIVDRGHVLAVACIISASAGRGWSARASHRNSP